MRPDPKPIDFQAPRKPIKGPTTLDAIIFWTLIAIGLTAFYFIVLVVYVLVNRLIDSHL